MPDGHLQKGGTIEGHFEPGFDYGSFPNEREGQHSTAVEIILAQLRKRQNMEHVEHMQQHWDSTAQDLFCFKLLLPFIYLQFPSLTRGFCGAGIVMGHNFGFVGFHDIILWLGIALVGILIKTYMFFYVIRMSHSKVRNTYDMIQATQVL